ncbi:hypothetical protein GJ700_12425 [Duganella sp. FT92W]|uniref:Uncharacterized protein n=1 Tax=Pseudoduganella rivuli TaxID=2666085 RepID=A0A7X2IME7_9BURK|nr:hypothetical protein [Pseudoduganella rivuli]MRV72515.1 hypothetical protein [Pseudoduganella rivuli]
MPTPDYAPPRPIPDFLRRLSPAEFEQLPADLAAEVAALRQSVDNLVAELRPVSTIIATGRDVLEQYKRLKG